MFRGNQNRIGITGYKVPSVAKEIWKFETESAIESSAVLFNNRLYFGSDDWFVYCLDSKTGLLQWRYETANQVRSTAAIAHQKVYIGSQDYHLYCLNALSGELVWKFQTDGVVDSSPLVVGNIVYFGSYDGKLYALNASSGELLWEFSTEDEIWGSAAYSDNSVYFGSLDGKLYSVWANNGTERWNYTTYGKIKPKVIPGIYTTPAISGDNVVFGSEDNLVYSLNLSTGDRFWMFKTTGFVYSSAAIYAGKVFISSLEEQNDGILYAIPLDDPDDNKLITSDEIIWTFSTHDRDGGSSPKVSVTSGKLIIGTNYKATGGDGKVFCLDVDSGEVIWNFTTGGDVHGSPLIAANRVYIGSLDNFMYSIGVKADVSDESQIKIKINIPVTSVKAGHAIENITFTAVTPDDEPIPQAWFNFDVRKGTLTNYYGTAFEDGTYSISYIAPEPNKVNQNINLTIYVNATRFPYKIGFNSVNITVEPRSQLDENNSEDGSDGDDDLFSDIVNPRNYNIIAGIIILIILNLIILVLFLRNRRKLLRLEGRLTETGRAEPDDKVVKGKAQPKSPSTGIAQTPKKSETIQSPLDTKISTVLPPSDPTPITPAATTSTSPSKPAEVKPENAQQVQVSDPTKKPVDPTPPQNSK
jgi:outer membrane protein assembly factor BamB